ncbi:MAG: thioredoxin family protein [Magnetococcus sp. WYHC-3]
MVLMHTPPVDPGSTAPNFDLPGVDGRQHSLADFKDAPVLVVMFICNHCPYVQAVEERLIALAGELQPRGVAFVAINSNDPVQYPEDDFTHMRQRAQRMGYPFPYLMDQTQEVASAYGAVCTPDFFVYDSQRQLRYRGRLDDSPRNPAMVKRQELRLAVEALLSGGAVPGPQHASLGCSIKWRHAP